jgi:predicted RNase H-like HicB family nuclease
MEKYSFSVLWSDEDDAYVATVPEFPGLSAFGGTPEEAIKEARTALEGFIEVYEEDGCVLPKPKKVRRYSGQIRLRLPRSLHEKLSLDAREEGVSLNTHMIYLLSENRIADKAEKTLSGVWPSVQMKLWRFDDAVIASPSTASAIEVSFHKDWSVDQKPMIDEWICDS